MLNVECRMLNVECRMLNVECRMLNVCIVSKIELLNSIQNEVFN